MNIMKTVITQLKNEGYSDDIITESITNIIKNQIQFSNNNKRIADLLDNLNLLESKNRTIKLMKEHISISDDDGLKELSEEDIINYINIQFSQDRLNELTKDY